MLSVQVVVFVIGLRELQLVIKSCESIAGLEQNKSRQTDMFTWANLTAPRPARLPIPFARRFHRPSTHLGGRLLRGRQWA